MNSHAIKSIGLISVLISSQIILPDNAWGYEVSTPQTMHYNASLLNKLGMPIKSRTTVRFSYWKSADALSQDITASGSINTNAENYLGWMEEYNIQPSQQGQFSVQLGSQNPLPDFSSLSPEILQNLYLQMDFRDYESTESAYEMLDSNTLSDTEDRAKVNAVPFAMNADTVDRRHVGTGSGNIVLYGSGGILNANTLDGRIIGTGSGNLVLYGSGGTLNANTLEGRSIGTGSGNIMLLGKGGKLNISGTNTSSFTIDADNSETGNISLKFGENLAKELRYEQNNGRFLFNDDLRIEGDLWVTGLINGVDIASLSAGGSSGGGDANTHLRVFSGAGLDINISSGGYNLRGTVTNFPGDGNVGMQDDTTNYVFIGSGGVTANTTGFPVQESFIPLAEVRTESGGVKTIIDRRVLNSDTREKTIEHVFHPDYANASYQKNGSDYVGQLLIDHDATNQKNFYKWNTSKSTLQSYDILIPFTIPQNFIRWSNSPIQFQYRSASAESAENKLNVAVYDSNKNAVSLVGDATNLANTTWQSTTLSFTDSAVWTPGSEMLIKITLSAKDAGAAHAGKLHLQFVEFQQE